MLVDRYFVIEVRRNIGTKGPDGLGAFEPLLATPRVGSAQAIYAMKPEVS